MKHSWPTELSRRSCVWRPLGNGRSVFFSRDFEGKAQVVSGQLVNLVAWRDVLRVVVITHFEDQN